MCCKVLWTRINPFFLALLIGWLSSDFFVSNMSLPIKISNETVLQKEAVPSEVEPVLSLLSKEKKCDPVNSNLKYNTLEYKSEEFTSDRELHSLIIYLSELNKTRIELSEQLENTKLPEKVRSELQKQLQSVEENIADVIKTGEGEPHTALQSRNLLHLEKCSDL